MRGQRDMLNLEGMNARGLTTLWTSECGNDFSEQKWYSSGCPSRRLAILVLDLVDLVSFSCDIALRKPH